MDSGNSQVVRIAKLETELDAERKRSAELDQAFKKQLDANRELIMENATLKADLLHVKETTVPDLQRSLKEAKDELSQERTKFEKHLTNEARSARNRETIAMLGAGNGERENGNAVPAAARPHPNVDNLVHAIIAKADAGELSAPAHENITEAYVPANEHAAEDPHAGEALVRDERPRGTTKLLSIRVLETAAPAPPAGSQRPREEPSTSAGLYRVKQPGKVTMPPLAKLPKRGAQKPVPTGRRGNPKAPTHAKQSKRPKAVRKLAPKKEARTTWSRPTATEELCAHTKCKNPYENEAIIPEGEEIVWLECDRCSKWYHCVCLLGRNAAPRAANKFVCGIGGCA